MTDTSTGDDDNPAAGSDGPDRGVADETTVGDSGRTLLARVSPARVRRSYVAKFALALLVVLVTVTSVGLVVIDSTVSTLRADVNEQLRTQAVAEAERLDQQIGRFRQPTRLTATRAVLATDDRARLAAFLAGRQGRMSDSVVALHVLTVGPKHIVGSTASRLDRGEDVSDLPWIETLSFPQGSDGVVVSDPYRNDAGDKVIAFVSPVNQDPERLFVVTVDIGNVAETFADPIDGGFTQVLNTRGTVLFAEDSQRALQPYLDSGGPSARSIQRAKSGDSGVLLDSRKEQERPGEWVVAYAPIEEPNWVLVKHAPADNAYRVQRSVTNRTAVLLLAAVVGVLALGITVGRSTVRTVTTLAAKARRVERGDYDVTLSTTRADELGELSDAIAGMRDGLVSRLETAREARETAETARERLEEINDELENERLVISILNRVIRHNLRNDIHVIQAHGELISRESEAFADNGRTIVTHADELADRSEKASRMESIVHRSRGARSTFDLTGLVENAVTALRSGYPDARITTDFPEDGLVVHAHQDIDVAIEDLVVNAIEHNDSDTPVVDVTIRGEGDTVVVTIQDNGPGMPPAEVELIESELETDPEGELRRRTGLGLWLAHWLVEQSRGHLTVQTDTVDGTRVRLELPRGSRRSDRNDAQVSDAGASPPDGSSAGPSPTGDSPADDNSDDGTSE